MNFEDIHVVLHEKKFKNIISILLKALRIIDNRLDKTKIDYSHSGPRDKNIF